MKTNPIFILLLGFLLLTWSCNRTPEAEISADKTTVNVNETVSFTNTSEKSKTFFWDFGDGETSTKDEPSKVYLSPGYYEVEMIAYSRKEKKDAKAGLNILVRGMEGTYAGTYTGFTSGDGELTVERETGAQNITLYPDGLPAMNAEVNANQFVIPEQTGSEDGIAYTVSGSGEMNGDQISYEYTLISSGNELNGAFTGSPK